MHSQPQAAKRSYARLVVQALVVLLLIAAIVVARSVSVGGFITRLTEEVHALGFWGPLAFGGAFVLLTVLLLPATPVVLAAGAVFGPVKGTLIISAASTVSAIISFLISRYVARELASDRIRRYPRIDAVWRALGEREGWKVVAAVRLSHAIPFGVQNLLFGLSPVRFWPFVLATWVAMLPGTILYTVLGSFGAEAVGGEDAPASQPYLWPVRVLGLALLVLALFYLIRFARRVLRENAAPTANATAAPDTRPVSRDLEPGLLQRGIDGPQQRVETRAP